MSHPLIKLEGIRKVFAGDEIEAVFGAPIALPDHADQALHAALEMRRRLQTWNAERAGRGVSLAHGIGIHEHRLVARMLDQPMAVCVERRPTSVDGVRDDLCHVDDLAAQLEFPL